MRPQYASAESVQMIGFGTILILALFVLIPLAIISAIVKYFREMSEERRRLRLEVGKLAHELESIRSDLADRTKSAGERSSQSTV